ncbi:MAG: hypothetical protein J6K89_01600 [Oscillospiraceae bacterium]|nr:hypothetical protein [Oscillospiraceae bacterium]
MADVMTIKEAVQRAKTEGLPVSEFSLRRWVRSGVVPVRKAGCKMLIYYPNLIDFLTCAHGGDIRPRQDGIVGRICTEE